MRRVLMLCAMFVLAFAPPLRAQEATFSNPVIAGDHPDPSIIRVGDDFWATATSSAWAPIFPLFHSRDLVNWQQVGSVFPGRPIWATRDFWAPEISEFHGSFFVYYVGRNNESRTLGIGVATAASAGGPYKDCGMIVTQSDGAIDPQPVEDEHHDRWLIWKEDGNSQQNPTPIWAQKLDAAGIRLVGDRKELIRNDAGWEGPLVEAPFILHRGNWYYLFYSGAGCCGGGCNYAEGVARSHMLAGPWEKDPANPILAGNSQWKCPGHGSIVTDVKGRYWFLHHAYDAKAMAFVGREAVLDEVVFGSDDWPTINDGKGVTSSAPSPLGTAQTHEDMNFTDDFKGTELQPGWVWPADRAPGVRVEQGGLSLSVTPAAAGKGVGAIVAHTITSADFCATVPVETRSLRPGVAAGIALVGNWQTAIGLSIADHEAVLWRQNGLDRQTEAKLEVKAPEAFLRLTVHGASNLKFAVSSDGSNWTDIGSELQGQALPPWDLGVRVAMTVTGSVGASARFHQFRYDALPPDH